MPPVCWGMISTLLALLVTSSATVATLPGVQPQLAAVNNDVYLTFGRGDRLVVARSTDGGETFGSPVALPGTGVLSLGMHRGPRIAGTSRALLVAAVMGQKGGGTDGDVVVFRSTDNGATWAAPVVINDVPGAAREGLHAMAASPSGLVALSWLDLRQGGTRLVTAVSRDHGATWSDDVLAYASPGGAICECCHPSIAISATGVMAFMFRNNLDGNRDMYVTRSSDGTAFSPAVKLGTGSWLLDACPMDGGALAFDGREITAVWRRENDVYLTTAAAPESRLGRGRDPVVAQTGAHRDIAWTSADGVHLMQGNQAPTVVGQGRFPSLLALPAATIIAWEHQGQVIVQRITRH